MEAVKGKGLRKLVRFQSPDQVLVAFSKEVEESIMDHIADSMVWTPVILNIRQSCYGNCRVSDSIFNKQHIAMAKLKITEICRNGWNRSTRRDVYINGKHSGIITTGELDLEVKSGPCEVTVQNIFPAFRSTVYINIEDQADNHVVFKETKWFANFLMAANLLLIILRGLVPMPKIVRNISNAYAFGWFLFSIFNHNDYFKTFAYSRVSICDANS